MEFRTDFEEFIDEFVSEAIGDFFDFFSLRESRFDPSNEEENSESEHNWVDFERLSEEPSKRSLQVGVIDDFYSCKDKNRTE